MLGKQGLNTIPHCTRCPRLIQHCQKVAREKRAAFSGWDYWGRPVPNFGDPQAQLLIVGLAPAAHGANRTGRMFTGDRSGEWLYRALHKFGFASQGTFQSADDGLTLHNALITAVAHCAPPNNKPAPSEIQNCASWLKMTFDETPFQVVVALGSIAWSATLKQLLRMGAIDISNGSVGKFTHGGAVRLSKGRLLLGSYHPSQQNTFTGRLTEPMFDSIFSATQKALGTVAKPK